MIADQAEIEQRDCMAKVWDKNLSHLSNRINREVAHLRQDVSRDFSEVSERQKQMSRVIEETQNALTHQSIDWFASKVVDDIISAIEMNHTHTMIQDKVASLQSDTQNDIESLKYQFSQQVAVLQEESQQSLQDSMGYVSAWIQESYDWMEVFASLNSVVDQVVWSEEISQVKVNIDQIQNHVNEAIDLEAMQRAEGDYEIMQVIFAFHVGHL